MNQKGKLTDLRGGVVVFMAYRHFVGYLKPEQILDFKNASVFASEFLISRQGLPQKGSKDPILH